MAYSVKLSPAAHRQLRKLNDDARQCISKVIDCLAENPRPVAMIKLKGREGYRIRVGDFRIIYEVQDNELIVLILKIGDRKEVYR